MSVLPSWFILVIGFDHIETIWPEFEAISRFWNNFKRFFTISKNDLFSKEFQFFGNKRPQRELDQSYPGLFSVFRCSNTLSLIFYPKIEFVEIPLVENQV